MEGARARLEDNLYEMSKPLTRTKDDVDREMLLKEQVCLRPFFSENDVCKISSACSKRPR